MPAANLTKIPKPQNDTWVLRLYVAGQTPKSVTAFANLKKIIGDLSNTERVLVGLDLRPAPPVKR